MTRVKSKTLRLAPLIALTMLISGCQTTSNACPSPPSFPKAKPQAGQELKLACTTQDTHQNICPHLYEWLSRVHTLEMQMKVQQ